MTNKERVLAEIRQNPAGLTDRRLRERTGISPHQQVNQICHQLQAQGLIKRHRGPDGRIVNVPVGASSVETYHSAPTGQAQPRPVAEPGPSEAGPSLIADFSPSATLVVVACSASKLRGGRANHAGRRISDQLPTALARELLAARERVAPRAHLNESVLLPAVERYTGHFYQAGSSALERAAITYPLVILSGGYGILLPDEPIGWYEAAFKKSWWPRQIIERALAAYAHTSGARNVVAFLSGTTAYAQVVRRAPWRNAGVSRALLVTPDTGGRGGAQQSVPRTSGEAFRSFFEGDLRPGWRSSMGLGLQIAQVA